MEAYLELEQAWAAFNKLDPAGMVACSSGTAALHLALEALHLPQKQRVALCDFNMVAVPRAVKLAGLFPAFVDCDDRLLLDPAKLRAADFRDIEAVIAVHVYGRQCDMKAIGATAARHNVALVEDLAEAHGVPVSASSDAACWSFYKNKIVAGEEGGAVWFRDPAHADEARQLRSLGFTADHDFTHVPRGHNYRMSNAHAKLVLDGLRAYNPALRDILATQFEAACPAAWCMPARDADWVYDFRVPGMTRTQQDTAVAAVRALGVPARHGFKPMSWQDEFATGDSFPKAKLASHEVMYFPLTDAAADQATTLFRTVDLCLSKR